MRKGLACPSCGATRTSRIDRKYLVMSLMRCDSCRLMFRVPTTSPEENEKFYQSAYQQGFTTELPTSDELSRLLSSNFKGHEKNYSKYIEVFNALGVRDNARILDYGCSWGYGSWQLMQAGFDVKSYEISRPRCAFAVKQLNVNAIGELDGLVGGGYDVFFSSHVIEHVPSVKKTIMLAEKLLKPGGLFVAFTPNGSSAFRNLHPHNWKHAWSIVHPNLLDDIYYKHTFEKRSYLIGSNPYNAKEIADWEQMSESGLNQKILSLDGNELLCISKMSDQY